jgi:hypothetical protein
MNTVHQDGMPRFRPSSGAAMFMDSRLRGNDVIGWAQSRTKGYAGPLMAWLWAYHQPRSLVSTANVGGKAVTAIESPKFKLIDMLHMKKMTCPMMMR